MSDWASELEDEIRIEEWNKAILRCGEVIRQFAIERHTLTLGMALYAEVLKLKRRAYPSIASEPGHEMR